ncbi:aromatic acid/H+ symport family MFS transporter [Bradyrhizobium sp. 14AA]
MGRESSAVDVQAIIDAHRLSPFQIFLSLVCFVVAVLDGMDVVVIGSLAPSIRMEWDVSPDRLANLFGAGLVGLAAGALIFGPLADKFGRRSSLVLSVIGVGGATLAGGYSTSFEMLVVMRFIAGIFLGGALPNAITVASEYVPSRIRFTMLTFVSCGFAIGGALGNVIAAQLATGPEGWRHVLILGGALPLLLVPVLLLAVPESVRYLIAKDRGHKQIAKTIRRIAPMASLAGTTFVAPAGHEKGSPVAALFAPDLRRGTMLIWASQFMALLVYYFLSSWLPTVIHSGGVTIRTAVLLAAMIPVGTTVGAVSLGVIMDRFNPYRMLSASLIVATASIIALGQVYTNTFALGVAIFFAGSGIGGTIIGLNAIAASFYPAAVRGTGVSWSLGIGRLGSILGSMMGGFLIALNLGFSGLFTVAALPAFVAALCMAAMSRVPGAIGHKSVIMSRQAIHH